MKNKEKLEAEILAKQTELEAYKKVESLAIKNIELDKELNEYKTKYGALELEKEALKVEIKTLSEKPLLEGEDLKAVQKSLKDLFGEEKS